MRNIFSGNEERTATSVPATGEEVSGSPSRLDYYKERIPVTLDVIAAVYEAESPNIDKITDNAEKEFYRQKKLAAGRGGGSDKQKLEAANHIYDEFKNKNPDYLEILFDSVSTQIDPDKPTTIYVPIQVKQALYEEKIAPKGTHADMKPTELDVNTLAVITSVRLAEDLQAMAQEKGYDNLTFSNDRLLVKHSISTDKKGDADIIGRFVMQPWYDVSQFQKGDKVLLADDCVQTGGVIAHIFAAMQEKSCEVLGMTALTCLPESKSLQAHKELRYGVEHALKLCYQSTNEGAKYDKKSQRQCEKALDDALGKVGLSIETMTNREILMVMSLLLSPDVPEHQRFFQTMKNTAGVDPHIVEGNDAVVISPEVVTPARFGQMIQERIDQMIQKGESKMQSAKQR